jgi:hypothetical protein
VVVVVVDPDLARDPVQLQRVLALQNGDAIRLFRAGLKRDIAGGRVRVRDALLEPDPMVTDMRLYDLIRAAPAVGPVKAKAALRRIQASETLTVGDLSRARREALLGLLPVKAR